MTEFIQIPVSVAEQELLDAYEEQKRRMWEQVRRSFHVPRRFFMISNPVANCEAVDKAAFEMFSKEDPTCRNLIRPHR